MNTPTREPTTERVALVAFVMSALGAFGFVVVYFADWSRYWLGLSLALGLAGFGVGLVLVAHDLAGGIEEEPRHERGQPQARLDVGSEIREAEHRVGRRGLLVALGGSVAALAAAMVVPFRSLGPEPADVFGDSSWEAGRLLIDADDRPLPAAEFDIGALVTAFPDGHREAYDAPIVVVRVPEDDLPEDLRDGAPSGILAFSKLCTHLGCPVGLYVPEEHTLLCPCHQSAFDVLRDAEPVFGPAARALPRLPLDVDDGGNLRAARGFTGAPGPSPWTDV